MTRSGDEDELPFDRAFEAKPDALVALTPLIRRITANNPGPMTFRGTCTYIVGEGEVAVIDPGPADVAHIGALLDGLGRERVKAILVTHTHVDHAPGARLLQEATGAPILGCAPHGFGRSGAAGFDAAHDPAYAPQHILRDDEVYQGKGFSLIAVATPGHCANHLCFALPQERALFSGDHVMAWATTVVIPPDGAMADYMRSLEILRRRDDLILWPGHGGPAREPQRFLRALVHHRRQREAAILARVEKGDETVEAIVAEVYRGLDPALMRAAGLSTLAHLEDLAARGEICETRESEGEPPSARFRPARGA